MDDRRGLRSVTGSPGPGGAIAQPTGCICKGVGRSAATHVQRVDTPRRLTRPLDIRQALVGPHHSRYLLAEDNPYREALRRLLE